MDTQIKRRVAIGFMGALMVGSVLTGTLAVAADDGAGEPHDVNIGAEATGLASSLPTFTINSVAFPVAASADTAIAPSAATPIVEHRDDRTD